METVEGVAVKLFSAPARTSRFTKKPSLVLRVKPTCWLPAQFRGGKMAMPISQPKPVTWMAYTGLLERM